MPLLDKEKMMNGFEKAVDKVNSAADKAGRYAKEKELDKKIDNVGHTLEKGLHDIGKSFKDTFSNL